MMDIKIKIDYVYINCDVMINILTEIKEKNLDVSQGWLYDYTDQIEWSLKILKENKHRDYKELKNNYDKIMVT
tara:strand:- start:28 stop:246 length:219 start_codon:yes stop_codon:yes gene_type:complete